MIEGRVGSPFRDREETYEAGEAYYVGPGHTPVYYAGTEIVEFCPTEITNETIPVVLRNLDANGIAVEMSQAGEPVMNHGLAYAVGLHPWEDLAHRPLPRRCCGGGAQWRAERGNRHFDARIAFGAKG